MGAGAGLLHLKGSLHGLAWDSPGTCRQGSCSCTDGRALKVALRDRIDNSQQQSKRASLTSTPPSSKPTPTPLRTAPAPDIIQSRREREEQKHYHKHRPSSGIEHSPSCLHITHLRHRHLREVTLDTTSIVSLYTYPRLAAQHDRTHTRSLTHNGQHASSLNVASSAERRT